MPGAGKPLGPPPAVVSRGISLRGPNADGETDLTGGVSVKWFGATGDGSTDDTTAIQTTLDAVAALGGGEVYFPAGTYLAVGLAIGNNTTLYGVGAASLVKKPDGSSESPVFTNADRVNGNSNITMRTLAVDGNRENPANSTDRYSAIHFVSLSNGSFSDLIVSGGLRGTAGSQGYPGAGDGLEFVGCDNIEVRGGYYHHNDYDGVKFRNCTQCTMGGSVGEENGRSLVQITGESGNVEATGSEYIAVTGCSVRHSDTSAVTANNSGIALHSGRNCTIVGNVIWGVQDHGIDLLEGSHRNVIAENFIASRSGAIGINLWNFASEPNNGNVIRGNTLYPLGGADGKWLNVYGNDCVVEGNRLLLGDGTGTWTVVNQGDDNFFRFNDMQSGTFIDTGGNTVYITSNSSRVVELTDGASITWDVATGSTAHVTLAGNRTLTMSNTRDGGSYDLVVTQDGVGNRTLDWTDLIFWASGSPPTLSTTASLTDVFRIRSIGGVMYGEIIGQGYDTASDEGFDTFSDGSGSGAPAGWTARWVTSGVTYTEQAGHLDAIVGTAGRHLITLDEVPADEHIELLAKVRASAKVDSTVARIAARCSGSAASETGYNFGFNGTGVVISLLNAGTFSNIGSALFSWSATNWYWLRFRLIGNSLKGRVWADGDPEPGGWNVSVTDSTVSAGGWAGFYGGPVMTHACDYFSYATNGATARDE